MEQVLKQENEASLLKVLHLQATLRDMEAQLAQLSR
jgi:hypothetical protein